MVIFIIYILFYLLQFVVIFKGHVDITLHLVAAGHELLKMKLVCLVSGDASESHEARQELQEDQDHHHTAGGCLQRDKDEVGVEQKESLERKLKKDGEEPEARQLRNLLCQVAEVAKVEPDNLNDDNGHEDSDQDKLVEIVEEMILDTAHSQDDSEPARKVDNIEIEQHLEREVGHELVAQFDGGVLHGVGGVLVSSCNGDPRKHCLRYTHKPLISFAGHDIFLTLHRELRLIFILTRIDYEIFLPALRWTLVPFHSYQLLLIIAVHY